MVTVLASRAGAVVLWKAMSGVSAAAQSSQRRHTVGDVTSSWSATALMTSAAEADVIYVTADAGDEHK